MKRRGIAWSLAVIASALLASAAARAEPRAVVELFTSQGCSSCPAADKLAGELARDPSLVVMSLAVDYWDYLGWKDTLALPGHTKRQKAYAKSRGDREIYTPQVVVNGTTLTYGTDWILVNGNVIRLVGGACDRLKMTANPQVSATFPCGSVIF